MTDTTKEAVERLACRMTDTAAEYKQRGLCCGQNDDHGVCVAPACHFGDVMRGLHAGAATLRALLAERDRMRAGLETVVDMCAHCESRADIAATALMALKGTDHAE